MKHGTLILFLVVIAALSVGFMVGWRARISTEEVIFHPLKMLPPVPHDLALVIEI